VKKVLLVSLLTGCTTIGHVPPPADWPVLAVTVKRVEHKEIRAACWDTPWYMSVEACAVVRFSNMTCTILLDVTHGDEFLEHEQEHCRGKDHTNETTFADAWAKWKRSR
jgi:hypothetical protein